MKKVVSLISVLAILFCMTFLFSSCKTSVATSVENLKGYMYVHECTNEDSIYSTWIYNFKVERIKEVKVSGYSDISCVRPYEKGFVCFGTNGGKKYFLYVNGKEISKVYVSQGNLANDNIEVYKGKPLIEVPSSTSEDEGEKILYSVDIEKYKLNKVSVDKKGFNDFFVCGDKIVFNCPHFESGTYTKIANNREYGTVYYYTEKGGFKNISSGFMPAKIDDENIIFINGDNDDESKWKVYNYNLSSEKISESKLKAPYKLNKTVNRWIDDMPFPLIVENHYSLFITRNLVGSSLYARDLQTGKTVKIKLQNGYSDADILTVGYYSVLV